MSVRDVIQAAAGAASGSSTQTDPYFYDVSLLLTGNGTNGAQNNTFLDSSTNNFTITRNGNTTQGTFSPYGNLWSNYFDGNGDYLQAPSNAAFDFGTGNFTIEAWVNITGINSFVSIGIATRWSASSTNWLLRIIRSGSVYNSIEFNANDGGVSASYTFNQNTWYHVAAVRNGSSFRFYVNGVDIGGSTVSWNIAASSEPVRIGANAYSSFEYWWPGYISNLRIVKGTAVYTSNFTPSTTPLTAVSGTSLLTCQSNRFIDNSSNNFTLTVNGNTSVQRFSPFNPTAPYSAATVGGSGYFDGSGDYLNLNGQSELALGTSDFTIEGWVYITSLAAVIVFFDFRPLNTDGVYPHVYIATNGTIYYYVSGVNKITSSSGAISVNKWIHISVSRSGTSTKMFVDGIQVGTTYTDSNNYLVGASRPIIASNGYSIDAQMPGYLSDFRVVKGTAVYTTNFTPPTSPVTAITNTQFLLNFTNAGISDAAMMNDLETVGNAQVSTSVKKYGTGSLYFDGTGDYLQWQPLQNTTFGTGNFTIEMWVYPAASISDKYLIDNRNASQTATWAFGDGLSGVVGKLDWFNGSSVIVSSSTSISTGTWSHVAYVRNGSTGTIYINGVSTATGTDNTNYNITSTSAVIGARYAAGYNLNGYIDDLRITKGYARYTTNFTPPAQALPTN